MVREGRERGGVVREGGKRGVVRGRERGSGEGGKGKRGEW